MCNNKGNIFLSNIFLIVLLIILFLINFLIKFFFFNEFVLLWFCNLTCLILIFSLYYKFDKLFSILSIFTLPVQILWIFYTINNIYSAFNGDFIFYGMLGLFVFILSIFMHLLLYPIIIYNIYKVGFYKYSLFYSFLFFLLMLIPSYLFSNPIDNVNCLEYSCYLDYNINYEEIISSDLYFTFNYFLFNYFFALILISISYYFHLYLFDRLKFKIIDKKFNFLNIFKIKK